MIFRARDPFFFLLLHGVCTPFSFASPPLLHGDKACIFSPSHGGEALSFAPSSSLLLLLSHFLTLMARPLFFCAWWLLPVAMVLFAAPARVDGDGDSNGSLMEEDGDSGDGTSSSSLARDDDAVVGGAVEGGVAVEGGRRWLASMVVHDEGSGVAATREGGAADVEGEGAAGDGEEEAAGDDGDDGRPRQPHIIRGCIRMCTSWEIIHCIYLGLSGFQQERLEAMGFGPFLRMEPLVLDYVLIQAIRECWDHESLSFFFPWGHKLPYMEGVSRLTGLSVHVLAVSHVTRSDYRWMVEEDLGMQASGRTKDLPSLSPRQLQLAMGLDGVGHAMGEDTIEYHARL